MEKPSRLSALSLNLDPLPPAVLSRSQRTGTGTKWERKENLVQECLGISTRPLWRFLIANGRIALVAFSVYTLYNFVGESLIAVATTKTVLGMCWLISSRHWDQSWAYSFSKSCSCRVGLPWRCNWIWSGEETWV